MEQENTLQLLQACSAGIKTAVNSIEAVQPLVQDDAFAEILEDYLDRHEVLGDAVHAELSRLGVRPREPKAMARLMAGGKIRMKYAMHPADATVADLMSDGCAMGVRTLGRDCNRAAGASGRAMELAQQVMVTECEMMARMSPYL